jgi:hypothetical protein
MNFPRPMLNSPAASGRAAGNAFFQNVKRRMNWSDDFREDSDEFVSHAPPTSDPSQITLLLTVHRIFIDLAARGLASGGNWQRDAAQSRRSVGKRQYHRTETCEADFGFIPKLR